MSDSQTVWKILWDRAAKDPRPGAPFEIEEVAPAVAAARAISEAEARRIIGGLLGELDRMPEGRQYFTREGNAVVPLPEFLRDLSDTPDPLALYPYEL